MRNKIPKRAPQAYKNYLELENAYRLLLGTPLVQASGYWKELGTNEAIFISGFKVDVLVVVAENEKAVYMADIDGSPCSMVPDEDYNNTERESTIHF